MKKIIDFVKKYRWILLLFIVLIAIIGDAILTRPQKIKPVPTPVAKTATYKSVVPGISTLEDLNNAFGTPVKSETLGSVTTDFYKSTSELRLHEGIIESGKVVFIKEIVSAHDATNAKSIADVYGNPQLVLYEKSPNSVFNLYAYPVNGIAYLGHKDGTLLEIWYFQPTSQADFISKWASDYSTTPSTEILQ